MTQLSLFTDTEPTEPQTTPAARPVTPANRRPSRTSSAERFGQWLQSIGCPYVAVDEARRAAFRDAKLQRFHFIVYRETGDNWLVLVGQRRKEAVAGMREWEHVFGVGFRALFAVPSGDGFVYRTLDGQTVELGELT